MYDPKPHADQKRKPTPPVGEPSEALRTGLESFLAALSARKRSPETVKKRHADLWRFLCYLDRHWIYRYQDVDALILDGYRLYLMDEGYSDSILEASIRAITLLYRFLEETGVVFENPARGLKTPKAPFSLGVVLSVDEMRRLLSAPDLSTPVGVRDRAIVEMLYSTGMRRGELVGLRVYDVDLDKEVVRVCGKGQKERMLPLGRHAMHYLRLYLRDARAKLQPKISLRPEALWLNRARSALRLQALSAMINKYAREAGLSKPVDTHTFRRTCATHLLEGGAHPAAVARLLGHVDLKSLGYYLRTTTTDLRKAHARSKPGG